MIEASDGKTTMHDHISQIFDAAKNACLDIEAALRAIDLGAKPIPALQAMFTHPRFGAWDVEFINERFQELYLHRFRQHSGRPTAQSSCPDQILGWYRSTIMDLLFRGKVRNSAAVLAVMERDPTKTPLKKRLASLAR